MIKLHCYGQDYEDPDLEWQGTEGEVGTQDCCGKGSVHRRGEQQHISEAEGKKPYSQQLTWKTISDDGAREASMRQRVRKLENNLFDEYWDELGAIKATCPALCYQ